MRNTISSLLLGFAGSVIALVAERYLTAVPEWAWRTIALVSLVAGLIGAGLTDTGYRLLRTANVRLLYGLFAVVFAAFGLAVFGFIVRPALSTSSSADGVPITKLSNQQLRVAVDSLVKQLREFNKEHDDAQTVSVGNRMAAMRGARPEDRARIWAEMNQRDMLRMNTEAAAFSPLRSSAISLQEEVLHRLRKPIPDMNDPHVTGVEKMAARTLQAGGLVGVRPTIDLAEYLEGIARQLPDESR